MKFLKRGNIAFVFYPHAEFIRLDTMPFAAHVLDRIIANGWYVDIFIWNQVGLSYGGPKPPDSIRTKYMHMHAKRGWLHPVELAFRVFSRIRYACVFSVGQKGSYVGGMISLVSRCPHVLLNDEFPSPWLPNWAHLERWSAHRAEVIIVPSEEREPKLREIFNLSETKPFVTLRNTAKVTEPLPNLDWHGRLGIPDGTRIFINAGFLHDWSQVPEIMSSVPYWPHDTVLLLHGGSDKLQSARYRKELSHLEIPNKIFWSSEPLTEDMLHSLIRHCDGSFGLYRNDGPNTELVGTSAGKVMRSIVCGTPVITSAFKSFDFVTRDGVGVQVHHPSEIPSAIIKIITDREIYRTRCVSFSIRENSLREEAWARIVEGVKGSRRSLNLSSPPGWPTIDRVSEIGGPQKTSM